ncbi:coiled-coil domain-containing protein 112-like [Palaemon carinicauda]|uniref:coiled-coil domain-containing protein 112-like n=1 Tax=Palaemon carinicauda TaxID=392227 RepID=UPI0035B63845
MESTDLQRLRHDVNSLWKRILEGETKVNIQEGGLRVGVLSPINRINFNRLRDGPLLSYLTHGNIGESPSMQMKSRVTELIHKVKELEEKVNNLPGQVCGSLLKQSSVMSSGPISSTKNYTFSKIPEIELITNHISYVKVQFQLLKRNGSSLFAALEECESELLKDISALNEVIKQESECFDITKPNFNTSEGERLKVEVVNTMENAVKGTGSNGNCLEELPAQPEKLMLPCSVPYFKHNWDGKDHQLFIKVLGKTNDKYLRLEKLSRMFPYKSREELIRHSSAYEEFLKERESVKTQIAMWKKKKEVEKKALEEKIAEERKNEEIKQKLEDKAKESSLKRERELRYRELLARKVEGNERERELQGDESSYIQLDPDIRKIGQHSGVVRSLAYSAEERQVLALKLKEYHYQRDMELQKEQKRREVEEILMREKYGASHRVKFLERDDYYLKEKKALKEEKEKLLNDRAARLEKIKNTVKVKAEHDRERILQPTQSHLSYRSTPNEKPVENVPFDIDNLAHLKVPCWRQGL